MANKCPICGYVCNHFKTILNDDFKHQEVCIECYERQKHRALTIGDVHPVPKQKQLILKFNYHEDKI